MANEFLRQFIPLIKSESREIGENIFIEGEPSDGFLYFILSGNVTIAKRTAQGDDEVIRWLGPGEFFGEMALIQSFPRAATVTAVSESVKLGKIDKETFIKIAKASPQFISQLLKSVIFRLSEVEAKITSKKEDLMDLLGELENQDEDGTQEGGNPEPVLEEGEAPSGVEAQGAKLPSEPKLSAEDIAALQKLGGIDSEE